MILQKFKKILKLFSFMFIIGKSYVVFSQDSTAVENPKFVKSKFWSKVKIGGGVGLGFGGNYTNLSLSPSAIYPFNQYVSLGLGVQGTYIKQKDLYSSIIYGGSLIGLVTPIKGVQLSAEFEQLKVNTTYTAIINNPKQNFWNTALFIGGGYNTGNITVGLRYNVLYKETDGVYSSAYMPFIRAYF